MKRILCVILALCALISCAAFLAGCSKESAAGYPVTVGNLTIDKEPKKIVVLNDEFADIISKIGYDIKMVGRSQECDQEFLHVVPIVGPGASPDVNAITGAGTDLVIADSTLNANTKQTLEDAGVKVLVLGIPSNEEELHTLYVSLGTALGGSVKGAEKGGNSYNDLFKMLSSLNTATSSVVQTAAYLYLDGSGQLCTFVKGTLEYKLFSYNGCTNVFLNQDAPEVDLSTLRVSTPKYIFYDSPETLTALTTNIELAHIDAIVNNHMLELPIKQFQRHGSTAEKTVFEMLNYIEKLNKATPDEATAAATEATTAASAAAPTETAAPTQAATEAPTEAQTEAAAANDQEVYYGENNVYQEDNGIY